MKTKTSRTPDPESRTSAWFFSEPALIDALRAEIDSWLGTPFHAGSQARGRTGGVDCIRLCEAIMIAVKVVEPFTFPRVPMDFTQHQDRSIILEFLRGEYRLEIRDPSSGGRDKESAPIDPQSTRLAARFAVIPHPASRTSHPASLLPGDLLTFEIGKAVNHLGIVYDDSRFLHCFTKIGTVLANITDPTFSSRLHTIFRARANQETRKPGNKS